MPKYLVETISFFRHRYVVEAKEAEHAMDEVVVNTEVFSDNWKELSQVHISENISSCREITDDDIIKLYNEDYPELQNLSDIVKLSTVNKVKYEE